MEKRDRPAFDELESLLKSRGYTYERLVIVPNELYNRLREETHDPFGSPSRSDNRVVIWYQEWTMVLPDGNFLNLCIPEKEQSDV